MKNQFDKNTADKLDTGTDSKWGQSEVDADNATSNGVTTPPDGEAQSHQPPALASHDMPISEMNDDVKPSRLTGDENIPMLLLLLFPASLRHTIAAIPQYIRHKLIAFFGICSMIAPLALWIAPSMKVWLSILAGSLLSILFCWALVWFGPEDHY